ncbi:glycoside hydrolase family 88 protein [Halosquirtibacter xylanolyticus]|uniref:glucuronyl hydrolase n=1 Tax=Halosquirtibacter xylanolyticus TaxID=3374599 RepID=UPI003748A128|nr:glycoside hydrolase family 88 protein [Prolixibacteraceae bacterium]
MNRVSKSIMGALTLLLVWGCQEQKEAKDQWFYDAMKISVEQVKLAANHFKPGENPRSIESDGSVRLAGPKDWTCGFFPGTIWYAYEASQDIELKQKAAQFTESLDEVKNYTHTHDLGFMLYCSYGNGFRLTQNPSYKEVIMQGSKSLCSRFNSKVGAIRSWDFGEWQYPVIVDNMMNLEMLMWASNNGGDASFKEISISHANKTMANHFRDDYSSYHVLSYDTLTGKVISKGTYQGYSDDSAWARGQGWGLYGYTYMYGQTKDTKYLEQARHIAKFIMTHPRMPKDKVAYWDFDAPNIPEAPRDASAAAVIATALLDLSQVVDNGDEYFNYAEDILKSLSTEKYLAKPGTNKLFVLKHSVGALPKDSEIDVPINYADYYYLEAMIKYAHLKNMPLKK